MNGRQLLISLISLFILLLSVPAQAGLQRYQASIEQSEWHVYATPIRCELHHPVPRYGLASFVYSAGGELAFEMHVLDPAVQDSVASMVSIAPFWKPGEEKELGQLSLSRGKVPFYVSRQLAQRMLYELDAGRFPTLQYKDWADQTDDVFVGLSSANFHDVLPEFQRCISELLPYGYDELKNETVHFAHNQYKLSDQARQLLSRIANYARYDDKVDIQIQGHTDSRGWRRYNQRLSEKRANSVKQYFVQNGVAEKQLDVKAFGERKPVASNRREAGRAKNRRVEVTINRLQQEAYPLH